MNPLRKRIYRFLWCTMIRSFLDRNCKGVALLLVFFNQTTHNRWRKCHDDILAIVKRPFFKNFFLNQKHCVEDNMTIWWVPSLWHSVTPPPLWKILATPTIVNHDSSDNCKGRRFYFSYEASRFPFFTESFQWKTQWLDIMNQTISTY